MASEENAERHGLMVGISIFSAHFNCSLGVDVVVHVQEVDLLCLVHRLISRPRSRNRRLHGRQVLPLARGFLAGG